jgi:hypothetical protein
VTRLEEVDVRSIEVAGDRYLLQYRGHLMPLIRPGDCVRVKEKGSQPLLVFSDGDRSMALLVDEIVDIVEEEFEIDVTDDRPGILGSATLSMSVTICRLPSRTGSAAAITEHANACSVICCWWTIRLSSGTCWCRFCRRRVST